VSILGGDELPQDEWGIDMVVTGSQKCLGLPPGLAILSISQELKEYITKNPPGTTVYFDLTRYFRFNEKLETPFTPALPLFYALNEALDLVLEEGLENRIRRHRITANAFYSSLESAGLEAFVDKKVRSNTVIAVSYPNGVNDARFRKKLEEDYGVVVAGGFGELKGKIFRIGNMGETNKRYVLATVSAILHVLSRMGVRVEARKAIETAYEKLGELSES
jgi:aspartate aminotransferase-like enzyme